MVEREEGGRHQETQKVATDKLYPATLARHGPGRFAGRNSGSHKRSCQGSVVMGGGFGGDVGLGGTRNVMSGGGKLEG